MNWGCTSAGTSVTVTFPEAYTTHYAVVATHTGTTNQVTSINPISLTQFICYTGAKDRASMYISLGY